MNRMAACLCSSEPRSVSYQATWSVSVGETSMSPEGSGRSAWDQNGFVANGVESQ